jgi:hypothetical protein
VDNNENHVNVPVTKKARDIAITMIMFSPHTSRKLQPLDRTALGCFKLHYNRAVSDRISSKPGKHFKYIK